VSGGPFSLYGPSPGDISSPNYIVLQFLLALIGFF